MERAGMFVDPVSRDGDAAVRRIYEDDLEQDGYVSNTTLLYSLNPAAYDACDVLRGAILEALDDRMYELATLAAARALRCRYCVSAHGAEILSSSYFDRTRLEKLTRDFRTAGLAPRDLVVMELADQVALDATRVTARHIEAVRTHGLSDREIFGVVLAAAYRAFYSKTLDAMGCQPDEQLVATNDLVELVDQTTLAR